MNGLPADNPRPPAPRRWRWMGPGLALVVLGGTGLYGLVRPRSPSAQEPARTADTRAAPSPAAPQASRATAPRPAAPLAQVGSAEAAPPADDMEVEEKTRREAARQSARQYRAGRFNAFFRKEVFVEEMAREGASRVDGLRSELADPTALQQLPADTQFMENKPEPVLERMAMIDLLFELAPNEPSARDAMTSLALSPIDSGLSDSVKKGLVGEKYDLLFRLAQVDRQLAVDTYTRLDNPRLKSLLREALIAGLAESGASPAEVQRMTAHL
ncbi:hypothetical protein LXT21_38780 [Myxococcus sp. K38C18041901]|uniref:hypothetical protein n=1 Tax=Myxococcus guangdongensis TaxID=2906760 RepID=UPI0020A7D718|nr:hypothetical protein [Myxococcus guangdongensis]MCP3064734.1 hypothetical protein [Myxococcus guangdongensis]